MKVIFLDIDGVLNSTEFFADHTNRTKGNGLPLNWPYTEFDHEAIKLVNTIINNTGARLVLTSTWRENYRIGNIIRNIGLPELRGMTPYLIGKKRGDEIKAWMAQQKEPIEAYVILDDEDKMLDEQKQYFIKTTMSKGLTPELADKAIAILNGKVD